MYLINTRFVLTNIILPLIVGGIMANFAGTESCVPFWLPLLIPCWAWVFVQWVLITALFLDGVVYWFYPRYIRKIVARWLGISEFKQPFFIRKTKSQFERELNHFVNPPQKETDILLPASLLDIDYWRVLKRNKTELEHKTLSRTYTDIQIDNIEDADYIELIKKPFRGLVLEMTNKANGLWIVVRDNGVKESNTVVEVFNYVPEKEKRKKKSKQKQEQGSGFKHKGWVKIPSNPKAYTALLKWLESIQETNNEKDK